MARYKSLPRDQVFMVPIDRDEQLVPGTLPWAIDHVIDHCIDLSSLDSQFKNDETGRPAYDPRAMLKTVLTAYSMGVTGSRRIERLCATNAVLMAMTGWMQPDHSKISTFVTSLQGTVEDIFCQVLLSCDAQGLLGGTHFSVDGVKLPSNASKKCSGTHGELLEKARKLRKKIRETMRMHRELDGGPETEEAKELVERLERRKERLSKDARRFGEFLKGHEPRMGRRGQEVKSNVTDNESAKMSTQHGVIQGYNATTVVDDREQIVVCGEVFGEGSDAGSLGVMLEGTQGNLEATSLGQQALKEAVVTADSAFHSDENLKACEDAEVDAYIPDNNFRQRDERFEGQAKHKPAGKKKPDRFSQEDFLYDQERDVYVCPCGEDLKPAPSLHKVRGFTFRQYRTRHTACRGCPLRAECLGARSKTECKILDILVEGRGRTRSEAMKEKIDTSHGRRQYERRLGIVEPVYANLRIHKRLDRFTLRGRAKVGVQWKLYCLVHNIEKLGPHLVASPS